MADKAVQAAGTLPPQGPILLPWEEGPDAPVVEIVELPGVPLSGEMEEEESESTAPEKSDNAINGWLVHCGDAGNNFAGL